MRLTLLLLCLPLAALAQPREARVGDVRIEGVDGTCWSNSHAPCDYAGHISFRVRAGANPVRVRVRSLGVRVVPSEPWRRVAPGPMTITMGRRTRTHDRTSLTVPASAMATITIFHDRIPMSVGADYQIELEVDGRRVLVSAQLGIVTESPDPEF